MKTIIFDFDGTIADTFNTIIDIINKATQKYGSDVIAPTDIEKLRGLSTTYLIQEFGVHLLELPKMVAEIKEKLSERMDTINFFEGMPALINLLYANNTQLGILTKNSTKNVSTFLNAHNVSEDIFSFIQSEDTVFAKHIALKRLIKEYKLDKDETIYIGDEVRDITAAHKAGIKVISVSWGFNTKEILLKHNPDYLVDTVQELTDMITK